MRKLQHGINVWPCRTGGRLWVVIVAAFFGLLSLPTAHADITNVIWQGALTGQMAIQRYDTKLVPQISIARFTNRSFLSRVGGSTAANQVLGVNLVMVGGQTNLFLSIYDRNNRQNSLRLTTNETTTLVSDGKNLTFTVEAPMLKSGSTWGGGFIRIAGTGHIVKGVPSGLNVAVEGVFIDNRPGDLNGTTGLVMRAKISTSNAPLRVLPQN